MKKWQKWVLGILLIFIIAITFLAIQNWQTISILKGTQGISENTAAIPKTASQPKPLTTGKHDWPAWLGPNGDKQSTQSGIITDWSQGLKQLWQVDYLCQGKASAAWSAPAIQGNRLVVTGRDSASDQVICLDPNDGSLVWKSAYSIDAKSNHGEGPRATAAIDSNRVYTFGRSGDLICWDLFDGTLIWRLNVMDLGGIEPTWGHSSSPLVWKNLVIVQGGGPALTIAFDKMTGEVIWKSGKGLAGYTALTLMNIEGQSTLLNFYGKGLTALTMDGMELWNTPWETSYDVNATTPIQVDNNVFITSGYNHGSALFKVSLSSADTVWFNPDFAAQHSDPYYIDGYIYGYSGQSSQNRGKFMCLSAKDGSIEWTTNDMGWGTCLFVDGYLMCQDIKGNLFLMKPNPDEFTLVTQLGKALGSDVRGPVWTMPVIANGKLYLRFKQKLVCYRIVE